jgi:hypothetical protein
MSLRVRALGHVPSRKLALACDHAKKVPSTCCLGAYLDRSMSLSLLLRSRPDTNTHTHTDTKVYATDLPARLIPVHGSRFPCDHMDG